MKASRVVFAAILVLAFSGGAADASSGIFDFLFGGSNSSHGDGYSAQPSAAESERNDEDNKSKEAARRSAAKRQAALQTSADELARGLQSSRRLAEVVRRQGPEAALMFDPTLRKGDIVVTRAGFEVFQGPQAETHKPNQFLPLEVSALRNRTDLRLMQEAGRYNVAPVATPSVEGLRPLTIQRSVQRASKLEDPKLMKMATGL